MSAGLWRLRTEVAHLTGLDPVRGRGRLVAPAADAVAGWGHKATAVAARRLAVSRGIAYLAIEDGFLRSVRPGQVEPPSSLVLDRRGIYYDARQPSDLQALIAANAGDPAADAAGRAVVEVLRRCRLSKYNAAPWDSDEVTRPVAPARRVLVVDQTFGDAAISGGLGDESSFRGMLMAAIAENPGAHIVVRLHPEVISGAKKGYLADLARREKLTLLSAPVNPWRLFEDISHVYTVSSQLGLEALMAGCRVTCFGVPFYAGWGLTDDRRAIAGRGAGVALGELVAAAYLGYCRYFDAWSRTPVDFATAADQLRFLAGHFHGNSRPVVGWRLPLWKRGAASRMLEGTAGPVEYHRHAGQAVRAARARGGAVAAWGRRADLIRGAATAAGVPVITIEDGFLRSVGLGAGFTPALSYVFDSTGIYYDPARASDIENLLAAGGLDDELLARARRLIALIRAAGVTKYNLKARMPPPVLPAGRTVILVPGQVADDESIKRGAPHLYGARPVRDGGANLALLERVRARHRDAFLIYRPHPDVEAGFRRGRIAAGVQARLADCIDSGSPLGDLIDRVDRIETATSLLGFEALLRGTAVTLHGTPFYGGWGLTEDLNPAPRRGRPCSLEELVAAALILYPVYLDAASQRVCTPEHTAQQLAHAPAGPQTGLDRLRRDLGATLGRLRGVAQKTHAALNRRAR